MNGIDENQILNITIDYVDHPHGNEVYFKYTLSILKTYF